MPVIRLEFNINVKTDAERERLMSAYCDGSLHKAILKAINNKANTESNILKIDTEAIAKLDSILQILTTSKPPDISIPTKLTQDIPNNNVLPNKQEETNNILPRKKSTGKKGLIGMKTLSRNK